MLSVGGFFDCGRTFLESNLNVVYEVLGELCFYIDAGI